MSYRIVYPVSAPVDGASFSDAVKNYIKLNRFMNIEQLILTDQYKHMQANIKYGMRNNGRRNASIQLLPIAPSLIPPMPSVVGFSSTDPRAPYPGMPSYVMGPSSLGAPPSIVSPAPLMVARPAVIGGPGVIYGMREEKKPAATPGSTTTTATPGSTATTATPGSTATTTGTTSTGATTTTTFGPSGIVTPSGQILPIRPVSGSVPFAVGVSASGRRVPVVGGPALAGPGLVGLSPVRFGPGL